LLRLIDRGSTSGSRRVSSAPAALTARNLYYFKAKDNIVDAAVRAHADELTAGPAALERTHRTPRTRLKAVVALLAGRRDAIATYGSRFGTLGAELAKRSADGPDVAPGPVG